MDAKVVFQLGADQWDPARAADKDHLVDLGFGHERLVEEVVHGQHRAVEERFALRLEGRLAHRHLHRLALAAAAVFQESGAGGAGHLAGAERSLGPFGEHAHVGLGARQRRLRLEGLALRRISRPTGPVGRGFFRAPFFRLGCLGRGGLGPGERAAALLEARAELLLEACAKGLGEAVVEVRATQLVIAVRRNHLHRFLVDKEERHVQSPAAEVVHQNVLHVLLLVQAVGQGGGRGLLDDPHHAEARLFEGLGGGSPLLGVELGRDRHHRFRDLSMSEVKLRDVEKVLQDEAPDRLRTHSSTRNAQVLLWPRAPDACATPPGAVRARFGLEGLFDQLDEGLRRQQQRGALLGLMGRRHDPPVRGAEPGLRKRCRLVSNDVEGVQLGLLGDRGLVEVPPDPPLGVVDEVLRVEVLQLLRRVAHQRGFAVRAEVNRTRDESSPVSVSQHVRAVGRPEGDDAEGRAEVDAHRIGPSGEAFGSEQCAAEHPQEAKGHDH
mmetsp:Transcript_30564/g.68532  ORF Transcript_30564/g.68532 Transcript_30564/m.68532 type:complete len:495 (-) Transcript_30564:249-1733(-)